MEATQRLPLALWMHILSFLPVKSLLVARAICKFFLTTIDDPSFVTLHLRNFPANLHQTLTLTLRPSLEANDVEKFFNNPDDNQDFVFMHSTVCEIVEIEQVNAGLISRSKWFEDLPCFNTPCDLSVVGSVDGLVLGVLIEFGVLSELATLWNPSIKKSQQIPTPSNSIACFKNLRLGLGYDVSCNDYKVLAILDPAIEEEESWRRDELQADAGAWVYSVRKGSWVTVGMPSCREKRKMSERLSFKGGLVWIEGVKSDRGYYHQLVRFDFATDKFCYIWMPYPIKNNLWVPNRLVMIDGGSSMGVLGLDSDNVVSIWVLGGMWWTRLYDSTGEGVFRMGAYRKSEMMWEYWTKGARPKASLYDKKEDGYDGHPSVSYTGVHIESLVLLKLKPTHQQTSLMYVLVGKKETKYRSN